MVFTAAITRSVPSTITRAQLWEGIKLKARNPIGFVPISECEVLSEDENGLLRRVVLNGQTIHEEAKFSEPYWASFTMRETGNEIMNIISVGGNDQTFLTFTFKWKSIPGVEPGSVEEKAKGPEMYKMSALAVEKTIAKVEELVKEGKL
ncbi:DUF1857-domain-containing protein [Neolentinus lepideus HHB14362 ss-1]|uniref:DUF1857-domain-containing protein n=1 Tax=Neolentinus lepideus HHB14362 ss-1 TaxID=1314782 RepID=A0A165UAH0_9AGAM|nr:DUF1857-domain-containing protein [Neolentinus lepideus HHB14362 ss-1]